MESNTYSIAARGVLAGLGTIAAYYAGNMTPLFYLFLIFEIFEYTMGMAAAKWYPDTPEDGWSSKKAIQGFVKKIASIFLVGMAWGIDFLIMEADKVFYLPFTWQPYFGVFALIYLILTEGISILESAERMGIHIPFLTSALKTFREKVAKGPTQKEGDN